MKQKKINQINHKTDKNKYNYLSPFIYYAIFVNPDMA